MTKVWIVEDQDTGDNAATVTKVFENLETALRWMEENQDKAFGYYTLACPVDWDGASESAAFEVDHE